MPAYSNTISRSPPSMWSCGATSTSFTVAVRGLFTYISTFIAASLFGLARTKMALGQEEAARPLYDESLAIRREWGDRHGIAEILYSLGLAVGGRGDYHTARSLHEEALALRRELGDDWRAGWSLLALGHLSRIEGDLVTARSCYETSMALWHEFGDRYGLYHTHANLGRLNRLEGDYAAARSHYRQALLLVRDEAFAGGHLPLVLGCIAGLAAAEGDGARAARLFGAAETLYTALHRAVAPVDRPEYERDLAAARSLLDPSAFAAAWAAGQALSAEESAAYALEPLMSD
jgi:tetratricopeptide (TPR) repeat protein